MIKMGEKLDPQNVRRASQVDKKTTLAPTLSEIVRAVNGDVQEMKSTGEKFLQGSSVVRRTKSQGKWGTLFSQYVKSS